MVKIKNRRRRYLINARLQLQFSVLLIMMVAAPIIILGGSLYVVNKTFLLTMQKIIGDSVLSSTYVVSTLKFSIFGVVASLIVTTVLLILVGIVFSHHVAGPLYRLGEAMEKIVKGEKVEPLRFRKTDILDGLSTKFNALIDELNRTRD